MSDGQEELRYPIGRFTPEVHADPDGREQQTVRQLVHHVAHVTRLRQRIGW